MERVCDATYAQAQLQNSCFVMSVRRAATVRGSEAASQHNVRALRQNYAAKQETKQMIERRSREVPKVELVAMCLCNRNQIGDKNVLGFPHAPVETLYHACFIPIGAARYRNKQCLALLSS